MSAEHITPSSFLCPNAIIDSATTQLKITPKVLRYAHRLARLLNAQPSVDASNRVSAALIGLAFSKGATQRAYTLQLELFHASSRALKLLLGIMMSEWLPGTTDRLCRAPQKDSSCGQHVGIMLTLQSKNASRHPGTRVHVHLVVSMSSQWQLDWCCRFELVNMANFRTS